MFSIVRAISAALGTPIINVLTYAYSEVIKTAPAMIAEDNIKGYGK